MLISFFFATSADILQAVWNSTLRMCMGFYRFRVTAPSRQCISFQSSL